MCCGGDYGMGFGGDVIGTPVLEGIVGSTAYGLATPESDIDKLGVFAAPLDTLLGMPFFKASVSCNDPDVTYHELKKYMYLAGRSNPAVLELLYLNDYTVATDDIGKVLVENRDMFISQRIRDSYGGYALQQVRRLERRGDGSFKSKLRKRKNKHKRHIARLVVQCEQALDEGFLQVRLTPSQIEEVRFVEQMDDDQLSIWFEMKLVRIDSTPSGLPESADWDKINDLLLEFRRTQWQSQ